MSVRASRLLQLSALLAAAVALCQARRAPAPGDPASPRGAGEVPVSQLRMLSLGLAHLLQGLQENAGRLEQQGQRVAAELDGATASAEGLRKQSLQAGRTRRQARKDLQVLSARGDRLGRAARDLHKGLEDLETEQGAMRQRMSRILRRVRRLGEPRSGGQTWLDVSSVKDVIAEQARRLAGLTSDLLARDRMIDRRLQLLDHLERQARYLAD